MELVTIDETSGNPFPTDLRLDSEFNLDSIIKKHVYNFFPSFNGACGASNEGYYHNDLLIENTFNSLAEIIGLVPGQNAIDIGYGTNLTVCKAMTRLGLFAFGLDSQDGFDQNRADSKLKILPYFNKVRNGVQTYCGTVQELLDPLSELRDAHFDLFTFWGSWDSGSNNFAVNGEWAEFRLMEEHPELQTRPGEVMDMGERSNLFDKLLLESGKSILSSCVSALNPNGGMLIVSSRYAYHGGGYELYQLGSELESFGNLISSFEELGAKEIYVFGISGNELANQLADCRSVIEGTDFGESVTVNSLIGVEPKPGSEVKAGILNRLDELTQPLTDNPLGLARIDAVYARF